MASEEESGTAGEAEEEVVAAVGGGEAMGDRLVFFSSLCDSCGPCRRRVERVTERDGSVCGPCPVGFHKAQCKFRVDRRAHVE